MREAMPVSTAQSVVDVSNAVWRKSSRSGNGTNDSCVEVAVSAPGVGVRDSKNRHGGALTFPAAHWSAFLTALR